MSKARPRAQNVVVEDGCKITLPDEVVDHYRLQENTSLRLVEALGGILLIPLTDDPMTKSLRAEIEKWQALGSESFLR